MGCININVLSDDAQCRQLNELSAWYACGNGITKSTRLRVQSATLLNIYVTKIPDSIAGLLSLEISDHLPTFSFILRLHRNSKKKGKLVIVFSTTEHHKMFAPL